MSVVSKIALFCSGLVFCIFACAAWAQTKDEAIRLFEEGEVLYDRAKSSGDFDKAAAKFREALRIFERVRHDEGVIRSANNLSLIAKRKGAFKEALKHQEKSLSICRRINDSKEEARILCNMAQVYSDLGEGKKAVKYGEDSLKLRRSIVDKEGEAFSLHALGYVHYHLGEYALAVGHLKEARSLYERLQDRRRQGLVLNDLGDNYTRLGLYREAIEALDKSAEMLTELDATKDMTAVRCNLGAAYERLGMLSRSGEHLQKALESVKRINDPRAEGEISINLGNVSRQLGDYEEALKHYEHCVKVYKGSDLPTKWPNDLIVNLLLDMGKERWGEAKKRLNQGANDTSRGRLSILEKDWNAAKQHYERAVSTAERTWSSQELFLSYTGLGIVHEALGRNEQAAEFYRKAIDAVEEIRSSLTEEQKTNFLQVKVQGFPRTAPYEGLARVLVKMKKDKDAFKESEKTKARVFAEVMSRASARFHPDIPVSVSQRDLELNNGLAALLRKRREAREKGNKDVIGAVEPEIRRAKDSLAIHKKDLRKKYPQFAATKYPDPMDLDETALKDGEWVLVYDVTDAALLVYLCHGKKLMRAELIQVGRLDIEEALLQFRKPFDSVKTRIEPKDLTFDFAAGKRLTDLLLGNLLSHVPPGSRVIVVPDELLGLLPFEMLPLNTGGRITTDGKRVNTSGVEFFGDRNRISYYQSITALTLARTLRKQDKSSDRLFVMADPVFKLKDQRAQGAKSTGVAESEKKFFSGLMATMEETNSKGLSFKRLPLTGELATILKDDLFKGQSDCYTGLDATKETLLKAVAPKMDRYGTVVFATHGYFNENNPSFLEPILALTLVPPGTDGFLRMSEVMGLKLNADIVALTACQTGLGRNISGEGTMGMGRAFQYAGAKSVLMSLWNVSERSSVELVKSFFRHIKDGKSKLEAIELARKEIREAGYDHPFFWAPFILVGEVE